MWRQNNQKKSEDTLPFPTSLPVAGVNGWGGSTLRRRPVICNGVLVRSIGFQERVTHQRTLAVLGMFIGVAMVRL